MSAKEQLDLPFSPEGEISIKVTLFIPTTWLRDLEIKLLESIQICGGQAVFVIVDPLKVDHNE